MRRDTKAFPISTVKAVDTDTGTFEAVVSVFNNVDYHGDRIKPGAFKNSLERWRSSGDPIPVIFSHGWYDLSNYLGTADPKDVRELMPGDAELPEVIRNNGGLMVKGTIDTDEPEGRKALKLLKNRVVREFSFAYDILDEARGEDGHNELAELDIIEVGPTLKGANPLTQLVSAKAKQAGRRFHEELERVAEVLDTTTANLSKAFGIDWDEVAATNTEPDDTKALVTLDDTIEAHLGNLRAAAFEWARNTFGDDLYWVYVEGTFADRLIVYVETWDDPLDGGNFYEVAYSVAGDDIELGEAQRVTLDLAVTPAPTEKAGIRFGRKEGRRNSSTDLSDIQTIHDLTKSLGADCADAEADGTAEAEEAEEEAATTADGENHRPSILAASLEAELLDL